MPSLGYRISVDDEARRCLYAQQSNGILDNLTIPSLVPYVLGHIPSLTSLEWTCSWGQHPENISPLLRLLSGLQKLQRVTLPKYFLDDQLLKALSLLPELRAIQLDTMGGLTALSLP